MRPIKFRGWDKEHNCFVYGWYSRLQEGARMFDAIIVEDETKEPRFNSFYIHDRKTIGQFTGLVDKNGVEIYEGDIVSYPSGVIQSCLEKDSDRSIDGIFYKIVPDNVREIVFKAPSFCVKSGNPLGSMHLNEGDIEVIGNFTENPELLESK